MSPVQSQLIQASTLPAAVDSQISASVAGKVLDAARQQGDAVVKLLDQASALSAGDPLTAQATGLGGILDVVG